MGVAIVAIPADDEKVYDISSEKVPHLTLAYLGDVADADAMQTIVDFTEHCAAELSPFHMSVDHRGTLGPDAADVVFFEKNSWSFPRVASFRNYLLLNDTIKKYFDASQQYEEWTPHLTLGYPTAPAHEDTSEHKGIHNVSFDRISVWLTDFEGPTFRLNYSDIGMDVSGAWSGMQSVNELFHYGKKGMKWGVRNDNGHQGEQAKTKTIAKADKKYDKSLSGISGFIKVNNAIASKINPKLDVLNAKPEYKDVDMLKPENAELHKKYIEEYRGHLQKSLNEAMAEIGTNASGTQRLHLQMVGEGMDTSYEAYTEVIKHATFGDIPPLSVTPVFDAKGKITGQTIKSIQESELKHYGKKGMRWGVTTVDRATKPTVTKSPADGAVKTKPVTVSQRRAGTYVTTKGGQRHLASDDAVKAAAARQKAKKSTTDSLTNDELKAANDRMRLEQEYAKLNAKTKRRGESFVAKLFQSADAQKIAADLAKRVAETQ